MKTIALATAALLVAAGSAFAGSDHFQGPTQSSIDNAHTASISSNGAAVRKPVAEGNDRLTVGNH
ncbi:MAG TPA: hypothetical protein VGM46_04930 [Mesorhizobium sp.]|jgi:hypothetical protein